MSKAQFYFVMALLFALAVALFAIQNPETISINFFIWQYNEVSKVVVILSSTAVGALVVMFLGFWWQFKKLLYIRQLENEIKDLRNKARTLEPQANPEIKTEEQICSFAADTGKDNSKTAK